MIRPIFGPQKNSFFESPISLIKMNSKERSNLKCNCKHKIYQFLHKLYMFSNLNITKPQADSNENDKFGRHLRLSKYMSSASSTFYTLYTSKILVYLQAMKILNVVETGLLCLF